MKKTELTDESLCTAVEEMQQGLIDADLGGNLYKKRVGLANRGKRGGARTLLATNLNNRWFFVHGFEKNDKSNITNSERDALHQMASHLLTLTDELLAVQLTISELMEICNEHSI